MAERPRLRTVRAAAATKPSKRSQVVQPTVRTYTIWSPTLIRASETSADAGNFRLVANLCDWLFGDDRIKGCMDARVQALFGLDPTFEKAGDKRRSSRTIRALEADEDWWDSYPEAENSLLVSWAILLGFSQAAQQWQDGGPEHDGRLLAKPEFWHPQHTRFEWSTRRWLTMVAETALGGGTEQEVVPGDGTWILHRPYGTERPWAQGLWRGLARLALLKSYAQSDWARLGEAASRTVVESDTTVSDTKENREELAEDIAKCGRDGTIVLPPGYSYKLVEASAATKDLYDAQIKMADEAIAIAIRGGNLSTNVTGGSRSAAEVQERTGDLAKLRFDAQAFTTTIHDQSLTWWAKFNFGDANLAPWPVYPVDAGKDLKAAAETTSTAAQALDKLLQNGVPVDIEKYVEDFEIPVRKPTEGEDPSIGQPLFQYHLEFGILTVNEARARLGLKPMADGDVRAVSSTVLAQQQQAQQTPPTPKPAPSGPTNPVDPNAAPAPADAGQPSPPALNDGKPAAHRHVHAADQPKGFVDGQAYADELGDTSRDDGTDAMAPSVDDVLAVVKSAASFDDLKERLAKAYDGMGAVKMTEIVEKAIVLAELAGRYAVLKDL